MCIYIFTSQYTGDEGIERKEGMEASDREGRMEEDRGEERRGKEDMGKKDE